MQKWQRRFFILYEHGLLRYALDEMVSAAMEAPSGCGDQPEPPLLLVEQPWVMLLAQGMGRSLQTREELCLLGLT